MPLFSLLRTLRRSPVLVGLFSIFTLVGPGLFAQSGVPSAADGFDPNVTGGVVDTVVIQPNGQILLGGNFNQFQPNGAASTSGRGNLARVNLDGTLDTTFDPEPNGEVLAIALQPNGKILIGGNFTTVQPLGSSAPVTRNHIARLNADGSLDTTFNPNAAAQYSAEVFAIGVQSNGQIVVGGAFTSLQPNGASSPTAVGHIARLNSDGSLDTSFTPSTNAVVTCLFIEPNGQILIGGGFGTITQGGTTTTRGHLARLNSNGSVDSLFDPEPNNLVSAIAMQPDGQILVGGEFSTMMPDGASTAVSTVSIARLNPDGTVDSTWGTQASTNVSAITVQPDGKILIGGLIATVQNASATSSLPYVARLFPNGTPDTSFAPVPNYEVNGMAVQADGKVILVGGFSQVRPTSAASGVFRHGVARINYDGTLDASFDPNAYGGIVTVGVQPSGQVIVGGSFASVGGQTRRNLARFNADGSVDPFFKPEPDGSVVCVTIQPNGQILVGGNFLNVTDPATGTSYTRNYMARFNADGSLDTSFDPEPSGTVNAMVIQPGKGTAYQILVGGNFAQFTPNGASAATTIVYAGRLNSDGTVDTTFEPEPNAPVYAIVNEPADNAVILGGNFTGVTPQTALTGVVSSNCSYIARVSATDASFDINFNPNPDGQIRALALQANGQILLGGAFATLTPNPTTTTVVVGNSVTTTTTQPTPRSKIARLNIDGTLDTGFNPSVDPNGAVLAIGVDPNNGQIVIGGLFATVGGNARNNLARLNTNGNLDAGFAPSVNGIVDAVLYQSSDQFYAVGTFTSYTPAGSSTATPVSHAILVNGDASLNTGFHPQVGAYAQINAIALQPNGQALIGGSFANVAGGYATNIARIYADTSFDGGFALNADGPVNAIVVQPDGSLFVGGSFNGIGLTVDINGNNVGGYSPNFGHFSGSTSIADLGFSNTALPNAPVNAIAVQPADGKVIVGGSFSSLVSKAGSTLVGPYAAGRIARYNTNGSVDLGFSPNLGGGNVNAVLVQPNGQILVGGTFTTVGGSAAHPALVRLNADGSVDQTLVLAVPGAFKSIAVYALGLQPNGQILVGGAGTASNGTSQGFVLRLNATGTTDATFSAPAFTAAASSVNSVNALVLETDGSLVVGGSFGSVGGSAFKNLVHLTASGGLDPAFTPNPDGSVSALALQSDGKLYVAGTFANIGGQPRNGFARLIGPTTPIVQSLGVSNNLGLVVWSRSGPGPEPTSVIFQSSLDDSTWTTLGTATYGALTYAQATAQTNVSGGGTEVWSLSGLTTLPGNTDFFVRALAVVPTSGNGSASQIQSVQAFYVAPPPNVSSSTSLNTVSGTQFYYEISSTYPALSYAASGLPPGLSLTASTYADAYNGTQFFCNLAASYPGANYSASNLPPGLSLDPVLGLITGTPTQTGTYFIGLSLTSASGATIQPPLTINVLATAPSGAYGPSAPLISTGVISGTATKAGTYPVSLTLSNASGSTTTTVTIVVSAGPATVAVAPTARLINLSAQAVVAPGVPLTNGLVITGTGPKTVLLRAVGPGIANLLSSSQSPALDAPVMQLVDQYNRVILTNQGWDGSATLMQIFARTGAFPLTQGSADCAVVTTLQPGSYTLTVTSGDGTTGTVLAEVYDADLQPLAAGQRLFNLSSNGQITASNPTMVAGFTISGSTSKAVLVRAIGPSLGSFGVTAPIPDPVLAIYDHSGFLVAYNYGWTNPPTVSAGFPQYVVDKNPGDILAATTAAGAFSINAGSPGAADSVFLIRLPPGSYTAQAMSNGTSTGPTGNGTSIGPILLEVYEVPGLTGN